MSYSIGDVSRVLGMTTAALHFYEKEGIIAPPKVDSGRRYYEDVDVNRLLSAKKYRSMGVSLREIAQQFGCDGMTGRQVVDRMQKRRDEALRLSMEYAALAQDIDRLIALGEEGIARAGVVDMRRVEDMLAFQSSSGGIIPPDRQEQLLAKQWLDALPAVSLSILRKSGQEQGRFALMLPAQRAGAYGFEADDRVVHRIKGGMALHAVVHCGEEQYVTPEVIFEPIVNFAREHRFEQCGAMFGNVLFVDCSGGVRKHFYDTYMIIA